MRLEEIKGLDKLCCKNLLKKLVFKKRVDCFKEIFKLSLKFLVRQFDGC